MKKLIKWVFIIIVGLILLGVLIGFLSDGSDDGMTDTSYNSEAAQNAEPTEQDTIVIPVTAKDLFIAYEKNEVAADKLYKGNILGVTGVVASIDSGIGDQAQVQLVSPNQFMNVTATGNDQFTEAAASLSKGQEVSLVCRGAGEIIGSPLLDQCIIKK